MEKLILERKPHAIVLGNLPLEVLLASMDLISKYKLPYICSIAMTPLFRRRFWTSMTSSILLSKLPERSLPCHVSPGSDGISEKGISLQQILYYGPGCSWAKATGQGLEKWFKEQGWEVLGCSPYAHRGF